MKYKVQIFLKKLTMVNISSKAFHISHISQPLVKNLYKSIHVDTYNHGDFERLALANVSSLTKLNKMLHQATISSTTAKPHPNYARCPFYFTTGSYNCTASYMDLDCGKHLQIV